MDNINNENTKKAIRLVIEVDSNIVVIKRRKKGKDGSVQEFLTLPGGLLEEGESFENAGIREAFEELNVNVKIDEYIMEDTIKELNKYEKYYFAHIVSGKLQNGSGEEFQNMSIDSKYGTYEVALLNKKEIGTANLLPTSIRDKLFSMYI